MKVSELMCSDVSSCGPRTNLAEAAEMLWKGCGALTVVDEKKHVLGIVTDRDICIALGTRNRRASEIAVEEVMSKNVITCGADDDMKTVLGTMQARKVWRLPVVTADKTLRGVVSLSAVVRQSSATGELSHANVMAVMKRICERRTDAASLKGSGAEAASLAKTTAEPSLTR
jgi:CBS-domain-containing membrane protein